MNTWRVILATMLIFGTGVVTGGLLVGSVRLHDRRAVRPPGTARLQPPASAGGMRLEFLRRMEGELNLTSDQRERVDQILKESQERTRKFIAPRIREESQKTREEFLQLLTPGQRARFDELWKQRSRDQRKAAPQREHSAAPTATNAAPAPSP